MLNLSIIIPTYNEAEGIVKLLTHLQKVISEKISSEIIIVDGGSADNTTNVIASWAKQSHKIILLNSLKGRAKQLNAGAKNAKGELLYFLHADTFPPEGFDELMVKTISEKTKAGSFRMKFNKNTFFFNFWVWFTRFKWNVASGGDQSLFITRSLFNEIGGFNEEWVIMEDIEIMTRIKSTTMYKVIPQHVITSTRKYDKVGVLKLQFIFVMMHIKKILGSSPKSLLSYYQKRVNQ